MTKKKPHWETHGPKVLDALKDVMAWIENWSPNFVNDPEWQETHKKVETVIRLADEPAKTEMDARYEELFLKQPIVRKPRSPRVTHYKERKSA